MEKMKQMYKNPVERRKILSITSASLIVLGWAASYFFSAATAHDLLMTLAAIVAGSDIAMRALNSLRNRHVSIELLVTIAAAGALWIGETWEAAAVTFLFIFGAFLEARTISQTRKVLQSLLDLAPSTALVLREGRQVEVEAWQVEPKETVLVKPGSKLAVDGVVIEGESRVDESAITGEPMPEKKERGSQVFAGTINQNGLLQVRAEGVGADTTLARIIRRVEEAQEEKAPTQRFIERFARWYTPFIMVLSAGTWLLTRDLELALTLLVIACPGALVISTPVSVVAGIGRGAKSGILIKGGEYLENSGKISVLALDKTGTLTEGKPAVTEIIPLTPAPAQEPAPAISLMSSKVPQWTGVTLPAALPARPQPAISNTAASVWDAQQLELLYWAAVAENGSEHPLAKAVLAEAEKSLTGPIPLADEFETITGRGVRAVFHGHEILLGNQDLLAELEIPLPAGVQARMDELKRQAKTAILIAVDGAAAGILGISDPIRPNSADMVKAVQQAGVKRVIMLTGDDELTANAIARQAGISEVHSELLPEGKLTVIRDLQREGHVVAMTGDGINDAPALAAADIGIAMGAAGTDIAIETADIALMADDLMKIAEAVDLSKRTLWNIRQNVFIALLTVSYLVAGVLLGKVHMAEGMLVHEASVFIVILNAVRLLKKH